MSDPRQELLECPVCGTHPLIRGTGLFTRPQRWSQEKPIRWLCSGPSRSGSTVVFQLMNKFDDGATIKTHAIQQADCPMLLALKGVICTIRHPYDMFSSLFYMFKEGNSKDFSIEEDKDIIEKFDREFKSTVGLIRYKNFVKPLYENLGVELCNVIFLKYEACQKFPELRVKTISEFMGASLSEAEIKKMSDDHTVEKNLKRIENGEHRTDDIKGTIKTKNIYFEKNHIGPGMGSSTGRDLPENIKEMIYSRYKEVFKAFNYEK